MIPIYPTYPPIPETRTMAEERDIFPDVLEIQCGSCKHSIAFKSSIEAARFTSSSGWSTTEDLKLICPVCDEVRVKPVEKTWRPTLRKLRVKEAA